MADDKSIEKKEVTFDEIPKEQTLKVRKIEKWDFEKLEKKILNVCIKNKDLYFVVMENVKSSYFLDKTLGKIFKAYKGFRRHFNYVPTIEIFKTQCLLKTDIFETEEEKKLAEEYIDFIYDSNAVNPNEEEYICNEIDTFLKHNKIREAILRSVHYLNQQNFDPIEQSIKEAVQFTSRVEKGLEITANGTQNRYVNFLDRSRVIPSPLNSLNTYTDGGYHKGEMNIVMAGSGTGKSAYLVNVACQALKMGKKVLYITLELNDAQIANRVDRCMWKMTDLECTNNWKDVRDKWANYEAQENHGKLIIKYETAYSFSATDLARYLDQLRDIEDFVPELICFDYLELARPCMGNNRMTEYERQGLITSDFRSLAVERDLAFVTATQANRKIQKLDVDETINEQETVGESINKVKIADTFALILQTKDERAEDIGRYRLMKNRHGRINTDISLTINYVTMTMTEKQI